MALMPTLIRWWEALRAPEVANWQQKRRVDWGATDGRSGGAQQTVWEILMEMERFHGKAKEEDQGALALVLDSAKTFERVSLPVLWAWATHFTFPRNILRVLCGYFEHQRRVQFEGCAAEPLRTITATLPGSKWSCLLLRVVLQDALSDVTKMYPLLKLRVFVDDITARLKEKNREVAENGKEGDEEIEKEDVGKKGLKLSVTENGKERKSKKIFSCGFLEDELRQCSKEGVTRADGVETLGVDLRTRVKK